MEWFQVQACSYIQKKEIVGMHHEFQPFLKENILNFILIFKIHLDFFLSQDFDRCGFAYNVQTI